MLEFFGDYQDAMHSSQDFLFHSRLSFALNLKLITPREVVEKVVDVFHKKPSIVVSQAEGFIRQVLGWREYMRGIYWQLGEDFKKRIFLIIKFHYQIFFGQEKQK